MMKIHNLDLQEGVEVKFINSICDKFCLKHLFESNWYFCNITEGSLWSRTKFTSNNESLDKVSSEAAMHKCCASNSCS